MLLRSPKNKDSRRISNSGFSIIDTVLAMVIIGIVIGSITLILSSINSANARSQNIADANNILVVITEVLKSMNYDLITNGDHPFSLTGQPYSDYLDNSSLSDTSATINVTESGTKKTIDIKVKYKSLGNEKSVGDTIIISRYGISK